MKNLPLFSMVNHDRRRLGTPARVRVTERWYKAFLVALGDDVQETTLRFYIAFKRIKNFACVEFRPTNNKILLFVKVDPSEVAIEPGFTRDVSQVGHFGTGDLEITLSKPEDLERAKPLIQRSYEAS